VSTSSSHDVYTLNISVGNGLAGQFNAQLIFDSYSGIDDAFVLDIATTLQAKSWPTGTTFQLQKDTLSDIDYQVDFSVTPLAFT